MFFPYHLVFSFLKLIQRRAIMSVFRNKWIINSFLQVHLLATQDQYLKLKTLSIIKIKLLTVCNSYVYLLTRPIFFLKWSNWWSILKNHFQGGFESPGENPYDLLNFYATYWSFYHHSTPSLNSFFKNIFIERNFQGQKSLMDKFPSPTSLSGFIYIYIYLYSSTLEDVKWSTN